MHSPIQSLLESLASEDLKLLVNSRIKRIEDAKPKPIWIRPFEFRGASLEIQSCVAPEIMLSGPSETGKTIATLYKLHEFAINNPGAQIVILRKTASSVYGTVLISYLKKILDFSTVKPKPYGGQTPAWFDYSNGSRVWIAGMDNKERVLSSERDMIYVNQAEELTADEWEYLSTRTTGRSGNAKNAILLGDCNPSFPKHFIMKRAESGALKIFYSKHEDNPRLYDADGRITPAGIITMRTLDNLTGVRKQRLRHGLWVQAEGIVYTDFDRAVHIIAPFDIPEDWRRVRVVDFGYSNPMVCLWAAIDPDGTIYIYRQFYKTKTRVDELATIINEFGEDVETTICDHDAEDRATLEAAGILTIAAYKNISVGLQAVIYRLIPGLTGNRGLYIFEDSLISADTELIERQAPKSLEDEFEVYQWPSASTRLAITKEVPLKKHDHALDALRYLVCYVDEISAVNVSNPITAATRMDYNPNNIPQDWNTDTSEFNYLKRIGYGHSTLPQRIGFNNKLPNRFGF